MLDGYLSVERSPLVQDLIISVKRTVSGQSLVSHTLLDASPECLMLPSLVEHHRRSQCQVSQQAHRD